MFLTKYDSFFNDFYNFDTLFSSGLSIYDQDSDKYNIQNSEDRYSMHFEVPGIEESAIDIALEDGCVNLDINAESRGMNNYKYSFRIPSNVEQKLIKASLKNGLLEVILPKKEESKKHKITINAWYFAIIQSNFSGCSRNF